MSDATVEPKVRHLPGEEGLWVLIFGDLMVFSGFFLTFIFCHGKNVAVYVASQATLNRSLGLLNTMMLLTSSWLVVLAVQRARAGALQRVSALLGSALVLGLGFCVVKVIEWSEKIASGITMNTNEFYAFYFMLSGIHLLHVTIGLGVLSYLMIRSRAGDASSAHVALMEGGGAYWHLVDLLWIVLFALFYLFK